MLSWTRAGWHRPPIFRLRMRWDCRGPTIRSGMDCLHPRVPRRTPSPGSIPPVIDALAAPAVGQRLGDIENEIPPREEQTPEALGALQKADIEKWWPIIKAANIKVG